jgi:hypothetical protein
VTDRAEIEAAARQMIDDARRNAESEYLDKLRDLGFENIYKAVREGLRAERFFEYPIGRMLGDRCREAIQAACIQWLTSDDEEVIAKLRIEARGAIAALGVFADVMNTAHEAEQQLQAIDREVGDPL